MFEKLMETAMGVLWFDMTVQGHDYTRYTAMLELHCFSKIIPRNDHSHSAFFCLNAITPCVINVLIGSQIPPHVEVPKYT